MKKILLLTSLIFYCFLSYSQQDYYRDVDLTKTGISLFDELSTKVISTHEKYLSYRQVWTACRAVDKNPDNPNEILLIYGYSSSGKTARTTTATGYPGWNREHTYPKSLGTPNLGTSGPGSDSHHLRASDVSFNSQRGNKKFVAGSGNAGSRSSGWYPGDEWKGDVARMMMYMYLRYGNRCLPSNVGIGSKNAIDSNMLELFLDWNAEDPPSLVEKQRNTYHTSGASAAQGNRNPFIDNPYLATLIWGGKTAQDLWNMGGESPVSITPPTNLNVNVKDSDAIVTWNASTTQNVTYKVYILNGGSYETSNQTYTFKNLDQGKYTVYLYAVDNQNNSSSKITKEFTVGSNVDTNPGTGNDDECGTETFSNIESSSSSYTNISWTGDKTSWTATHARTDIKLNGKAIVLNGKKGDAIVKSGTISGGISSFKVTTQRKFSGTSGQYTLYINSKEVGKIPYSDQDKETTTTISNINIKGNFTITLKDTSTNRVLIDNISWSCYEGTASNDEYYFKSLKVYPNPSQTGEFSIYIPNTISITNASLYSVTGQLLQKQKIDEGLKSNLMSITNLTSGVYFLELKNTTKKTTRKLIVK